MRLRRPRAILERMPLRCLLVDDSTRFLEAARAMLEHDGVEVVGVASTPEEAIASVSQLDPDVVIVDIALGRDSGFELARRLDREAHGTSRHVVLISTHTREDFAELIAVSPAAGFVSKSELSGRAIRALMRGRDQPR